MLVFILIMNVKLKEKNQQEITENYRIKWFYKKYIHNVFVNIFSVEILVLNQIVNVKSK